MADLFLVRFQDCRRVRNVTGHKQYLSEERTMIRSRRNDNTPPPPKTRLPVRRLLDSKAVLDRPRSGRVSHSGVARRIGIGETRRVSKETLELTEIVIRAADWS